MNININNYEEWMIDYVEGNLSAGQRREFFEFLSLHPALKSELELFESTKLQPDMNVVFAGKEALKQKEGGKVIVMANWVRYASAAAAVVMIFAGIRFFGGTNREEQLAIKQYNRQTIDATIADLRKTDVVIQPENEHLKMHDRSNEFAKEEKKEIEKQQQIDPTPEKLMHREDMQVITGIEFAAMEPINNNLQPNLKDGLEDVREINTDQFAVNNQSDRSKNISLNDNNSIVDWMNDAMAMGNEVGGLLESFIMKDEKEEVNNAPYKTTSVNLFGITYYSRKKSN